MQSLRLYSLLFINLFLFKKADLIGLGPFMLIKARPFMEFLSGKWSETPADDSYIRLFFIAKGLHAEPVPSCVTEVRRGGAYGTWRYYFFEMWMIIERILILYQ